ncbi:phosphotransferase [Parenemella sanctibonifatiensis]|uniref:phosphotransferase n=1 Tax=Parenemella sanctibonifatiensis TaxID=2016505 RepID=UPI0015C59773|nr:phosphotransferase [Parenemella sanctibonifatiensis]
MDTDESALHALRQPATMLGLGDPVEIRIGRHRRSIVGLYPTTAIKCYYYQAQENQVREQASMRRWSHFQVVPDLLASGACMDGTPWIHMSRLAGQPMDVVELNVYGSGPPMDLGRILALLHWHQSVAADKVMPSTRCTAVHGHGDFGAHNVLVDSPHANATVTGLIDFEKSKVVCFMADLASYWAHCATGKAIHWKEFRESYALNAPKYIDLTAKHLHTHAAIFGDWAKRSLAHHDTERVLAAIDKLRSGLSRDA